MGTIVIRPQGRDDETPQHAVGALAGWSYALFLPARTEALVGPIPRAARCSEDGLAPVLGAVHVMMRQNTGGWEKVTVGEIATDLFVELAEGFRQRVLRTPIVIDGDSA